MRLRSPGIVLHDQKKYRTTSRATFCTVEEMPQKALIFLVKFKDAQLLRNFFKHCTQVANGRSPPLRNHLPPLTLCPRLRPPNWRGPLATAAPPPPPS